MANAVPPPPGKRKRDIMNSNNFIVHRRANDGVVVVNLDKATSPLEWIKIQDVLRNGEH